MMKHKYGLWGIILTLVVVFCFWGKATITQAAVAADDIDDGITNWQPQGTTVPGQKQTYGASSNLTLNYIFDYPITGGSSKMIQDSEFGANGVSNTKMNIWTNDSSVSAGYWPFFQGFSIGYNFNSLEYGIVYSPSQSSADAKSSVLNGMTGKQYFVGTDKNGDQAQKVIGTYSKTDSSGIIHNFELEILLRPDPDTPNTISQELYLKNISDAAQQYGIFFNENVMSPVSGFNKGMFALPDNGGLYYTHDANYRSLVPTKIKDGPTNYAAFPGNVDSGNADNYLSGFNPSGFSGTGAESQNFAAGTQIPGTANVNYPYYTSKWPYTSIAPQETRHYHSEVGLSHSKYVTPNVSKQFKNETSTDGKNHVGDKLKFTVMAANDGYNSQWNSLNLKDALPAGLQLDPNSMKVTSPSGTQTIPASAYDAANNTLNFPSAINLTDFQTATFTFETKIQSAASDKTLTNNATVSGADALAPGTPNVSATGSVDIPVEKSPYLSTFTKQVKNKTAGDADFQNATTGVYGDTVSYQIKYGVNSDSQYSLAAGQLQDKLPDGLTLVPGSISMTANGTTTSPTDLTKVTLPKLAAGQTATINFDAKVTGTTPINLTNNAAVSGTTDNNTTVSDQSNDAILKPGNWVGFISLPDQIDFGTHETKETNFTNQSTTTGGSDAKTLVVDNYSSSPNYQVNVAYDNNGEHKLTDAKGDTITPSDNQNLLFFKDVATGNWTAVTPTGTPINSAGFAQTGLNDLTSAVGAGKWRMSNRTYQPKVGTYNGTLTWQVANSVS